MPSNDNDVSAVNPSISLSPVHHVNKATIKRGRTRTVAVPGVGPVLLRPLPASAVIDFQRELSQVAEDSSGVNQISILLRAVSAAMVDDNGQRLFEDGEEGDIPFDIFTELQPVVMEMLGVKTKAKEDSDSGKEEGDVNPLDTTPSVDLPTGSVSG